MNAGELERVCMQEIRELHRFFVDWFRGTLPDTDEAWSRVTQVLDDEFLLVSPEGARLPRESLLDGIRARHGRHGPTDDFAIWTRNVEVRHADESLALATYEEWQRRDGEDRGRLSTALFSFDPGAPNGLRWRHVHETWLPPTRAPDAPR